MSAVDPKAFIPQSGMTKDHFTKIQQVAQEEQVIAVVRNTNAASTKLIEMGCPGKPLSIKFHTSDSTGVVTAANSAEFKTAYDAGYYVVDADKVARRIFRDQFNGREVKQELKLQNPFWRVEAGQVIDPKLKKPLVGDYDLMGIINPKNPGQNIVLVAVGGQTVSDFDSPIVRNFRDKVNAKLDRPRLLHGAQDQFAGFRGGATVFLPDGRVLSLPDDAAVKEFYELIGRQTIKGQYLQPPRPAMRGIPVVSGRGLADRAKSGMKAAARDQNAMALLGRSLGVAIQGLGDLATQRRIQQELETTHANAITDILATGNGVLVIIRMQEWAQPDFNGMRARALLGVIIKGGPTQSEVLNDWQQQPQLLKKAPDGWQTFEQYVWIDPSR